VGVVRLQYIIWNPLPIKNFYQKLIQHTVAFEILEKIAFIFKSCSPDKISGTVKNHGGTFFLAWSYL